jgi:hypothetical protein
LIGSSVGADREELSDLSANLAKKDQLDKENNMSQKTHRPTGAGVRIGTRSHGQAVAIGGDNHGPITNTVVIGTKAEAAQPFEVRDVRLWPITDRALQIISLATAIPGLGALTTGLIRSYHSLTQVSNTSVSTGITLALIVGAGLLLLTASAAWLTTDFLRKGVYRLSRTPSTRAWAGVKNAQGRSQLARVKLAGVCQICGGPIYFHDKPKDVETTTDPQTGRVSTRVMSRQPVTRCSRNKGHEFPFEITKADEIMGG